MTNPGSYGPTPQFVRPGVMQREVDLPGNAQHLAQPLESSVRAAKGDLSMNVIRGFEPRALSHPGVPWKGLRQGR